MTTNDTKALVAELREIRGIVEDNRASLRALVRSAERSALETTEEDMQGHVTLGAGVLDAQALSYLRALVALTEDRQ
jgi:hypothetical protein